MWRQSVFRQHRRYDTPTRERVLCHGLRTGRADVNMYKTWNEDTLSQDATSHTSQASRSLLENRARYIITPRLGGNEGWALTTGRRGVITSLAAAPEQAIKKRGAVAVWQAGIGPCVSRSLLMLANVAHNHTHTHTRVRWGGGMDGLTQCHDTHNLRPSAYHAPINEQSYVTLWDCKVSSVITAGIFISHQTPIFILISDTTVPPWHHFQKCHCTLTFWIIFFKAETTLSWCQCGRGGCLSGQCSSF